MVYYVEVPIEDFRYSSFLAELIETPEGDCLSKSLVSLMSVSVDVMFLRKSFPA